MKKIIVIVILILCVSTSYGQNINRLNFINKFLTADFQNQVKGANLKTVDFSNYILTPGDTYSLTIALGTGSNFSNIKALDYPLILSTDYKLNLPIGGEITVKGKTLKEVEKMIEERLDEKNFIYQFISFQILYPAQFDVMIYGQVMLPGVKLCNPEITLSEILGMSGGFMPSASYRRIKLVRNGEPLYFDISEYYYSGKIEQNPKLQPGDYIFIEEFVITVQISGKVKYPGVYQLVQDETFSYLLEIAGKFNDMEIETIEVNRIQTNGQEKLFLVSAEEALSFIPANGDFIYVPSTDDNKNKVIVAGAIGAFSSIGDSEVSIPDPMPMRLALTYHEGMTLLSALIKAGGPSTYAILDRCLIDRKDSDEKIIVDLFKLWVERDRSYDVILQPGDSIFIPMKETKIIVAGEVNTPGAIDFVPGMTVGDYLLFSGGLDNDSANPNGVYLFDSSGSKEKTTLSTVVDSGQNIFVDRDPILKMDSGVQKFFTVTGWVVSVAAITTSIITLIKLIQE